MSAGRSVHAPRLCSEQARQAAHSSQLTVCGLSLHLGQCTHSMQNGRLELRTPVVQAFRVGVAPKDAQAREVSAFTVSKVLAFMARNG